jgi:hypothetical protein
MLLTALWARSYDYRGYLAGHIGATRSFVLESFHERLFCTLYYFHSEVGFKIGFNKIDELFVATYEVRPKAHYWGFGAERWTNGGLNFLHCSVPHWFAIGIVTALIPVIWLRWRFSLRTLLIATTFVAVVLGLIVWLGR